MRKLTQFWQRRPQNYRDFVRSLWHQKEYVAWMVGWLMMMTKSWYLIKPPQKSHSSVMTYAFPNWEFAANTHLLKVQRLQKQVCPHSRQHSGYGFVYVAFKIPYVDGWITKSCRWRVELHKITKTCSQCYRRRSRHKRYKSPKHAGGQACDSWECLELPLQQHHGPLYKARTVRG